MCNGVEGGGSTAERDICLPCLWTAKCLSHCKGKEKAHEVHLDNDDDAHLPVNDDSEDDSKESSTERYVV